MIRSIWLVIEPSRHSLHFSVLPDTVSRYGLIFLLLSNFEKLVTEYLYGLNLRSGGRRGEIYGHYRHKALQIIDAKFYFFQITVRPTSTKNTHFTSLRNYVLLKKKILTNSKNRNILLFYVINSHAGGWSLWRP